MKKILFCLVFLASFSCAKAQCKCKCDSLKTYYCSVTYSVSGHAVIDDPFQKGNLYVIDNKGNEMDFKSFLNMLNFFADKGWEYVEIKNIDSRPNVLLKKRAKNKNGLLDNIKTRRFGGL